MKNVVCGGERKSNIVLNQMFMVIYDKNGELFSLLEVAERRGAHELAGFRLYRVVRRLIGLGWRYVRYALFRLGVPGSRVGTVKGKTFWGRRLTLPASDKNAMSLYAFGLLSGDEELRLTRFLIKNLRADDVFYDVGANYGFYAFLAVELGSEVHVFEPVSDIFPYLKLNTRMGEPLTLNNIALADASGPIAFYEAFSSHESGGSTMRADVNEQIPGHFRTISVLAGTLDSYLAGHSKPSIIKLDVEGGEYRVLRGAAETLKAKPLIIMEVWYKPSPNSEHVAALRFLYDHGYRSFRITAGGELELILDLDTHLEKTLESETGTSHDNFVFRADGE